MTVTASDAEAETETEVWDRDDLPAAAGPASAGWVRGMAARRAAGVDGQMLQEEGEIEEEEEEESLKGLVSQARWRRALGKAAVWLAVLTVVGVVVGAAVGMRVLTARLHHDVYVGGEDGGGEGGGGAGGRPRVERGWGTLLPRPGEEEGVPLDPTKCYAQMPRQEQESVVMQRRRERRSRTVGLLPSGSGRTVHASSTAPAVARNVLMIMADDLGIGDLPIPEFFPPASTTKDSMPPPARAPALERLARESTVLTSFYAAGAVCTPTRASIMTSLFPYRFDMWYEYGLLTEDRDKPLWLPRVPTMPEAFRSAGFATAHVGKWHLGGMNRPDVATRREYQDCSVPGPNQHGFEHYVGLEQGPDAWATTKAASRSILYTEGARHLVGNDLLLNASQDVLTDRFVDETIRFVTNAAHTGARFYAQLWLDAPHSPVEPLEPETGLYRPCGNTTRRRRDYLSVVSHMDSALGRLLHFMDSSGLAKDTLVVFLSDNGPEEMFGSPGPYRGRKRYLYEGGIRVPAMMRLPGVLPARIVDMVASTVDLWPTLLASVGVRNPELFPQTTDGVNLWPALCAARPEKLERRERQLFWNSGHPQTKWAVRQGDHKLVRSAAGDYELFNIRKDPLELRNLIRFRSKRTDPQLRELMNSLKQFADARQRKANTEPRYSDCSIPLLSSVAPF